MSCTVRVASPLRSYTAGAAEVVANGTDIAALLMDLDTNYRGIRFRMIDEQDRIRPRIRLFVNQTEVVSLEHAVSPGDTLHLICALSGG
ncbi:MAG TPA: MoaD/ThiS family protein [Steroidobacteraceae bacterium]|nr:MoaD/ThiS family protein [Steroidobacteraceae bacterium]